MLITTDNNGISGVYTETSGNLTIINRLRTCNTVNDLQQNIQRKKGCYEKKKNLLIIYNVKPCWVRVKMRVTQTTIPSYL